jgi:glycosyltransferase involved in cell wall biosynthesis
MSTPSTAIDPVRKQSTSLPFGQARHLILLCPDLHETGGIGMVSRLALRALQSYTTATGGDGQVWSYRDPAADGSIPQVPRWAIQYARGRKTTAAFWGLKGGLSDGRDTLVVAMHLHLAPLALPLVKRGARLAVFLHGIEAWIPLSGLRTRALEHPALLLANSHHTINRFKKANPVFADAVIQTCLLGVPESESTATQPTIAGPYALIVGRLSSQERYKGHDVLLQLWRETTKVYPTARLIIAGDGDDRVRLENEAKGLGLTDAVSFLGRVTDEQLESLYRDCSFFVMPSSEEGFGLVFLEAMRAGKACLATKGAAEEVIEDGVTGVIVPAHDRKALLTAITAFFRDPEMLTRMGRAGCERYRTHFTQMHFEKRFLAALDLQAQTGEI